jgi:tRNA(fMet)-specific endonuclease VapC
VHPAVIDTDILSEVLRRRDPWLVRRCDGYLRDHGRLAVSAVTVFEIVSGWHRVGRHDKADAFLLWVEAAELLDVDRECANLAGQVDGALQRAGRRVGMADVLIAATALRHGRVLVSGNEAHFRRITDAGFPLHFDNWRT